VYAHGLGVAHGCAHGRFLRSPNVTEDSSLGTSLSPAQQAQVRENLGLVADYLRRHASIPPRPMSRCEYDDLFQEGVLGLIQAVIRYDAGRGRSFATFAVRHIHGAVSRALAERFATVHVPVKRVKEAGRARRERAAATPKGRTCHERGTVWVPPISANLGDQDVEVRDVKSSEARPERRLGDVLRERYEAAVRSAGARAGLFGRGKGRSDRAALAERLIRDRLLIPEEDERTSLREIARRFGCTVGRVLGCERRIAALAAANLARDPVYARIRALAARQADALALEVNERLVGELSAIQDRHFASLLERLGDEDMSLLLIQMARHVCGSPIRLARTLFRLSGPETRARVIMDLAGLPLRAKAA
jgi:RNA polymerase sigma factor (sigma-70 family)